MITGLPLINLKNIKKQFRKSIILSVHFSNLHIVAQIIDDDKKKTLAYATTVGAKMTGTKTEKAAKIGEEIAKKAKAAKVKKVVFDRGSKLYAGRMSALADAARKEGLEF